LVEAIRVDAEAGREGVFDGCRKGDDDDDLRPGGPILAPEQRDEEPSGHGSQPELTSGARVVEREDDADPHDDGAGQSQIPPGSPDECAERRALGDREGAGSIGDREGAGSIGDREGAGSIGDREGAGGIGDREARGIGLGGHPPILPTLVEMVDVLVSSVAGSLVNDHRRSRCWCGTG
jgi:hypothetical protein